jgi:hypothetical protein
LSRGSRNGASRVKSELTRDGFAISCLNGFPRRLSRRYFSFDMAGGLYYVRQVAAADELMG